MSIRKVVILDSAKEELKDIKKYVRAKFGDSVWNTINPEYKTAIQRIKQNPQSGGYIDELKELGVTNVKYTLVRQTRVVYEFDDSIVLIHMFINTKRDFRTHLFKRLLNQ
ncbi:type II toxin-antitoxin system RelE/ParE family toxin [Pectobacterium sp. A5351]|uniref:type II toxin-antitoxin system RelE/ParE family toxin n=1 Tax=Pectobacterium sp. A5351 TaxID=2914983 RepID=UPI00232C047E|nr:type II toxin-antitoxin system RelE/ParE family toxin [Pectobacterium sp. A5351]WCG83393.1 type II toxin-antitoxin system RelE/ParE family toxin [Pectobacterium sp. A5351]